MRERTARLASTPIRQYAYVDATWGGSGELDIAHALAPTIPANVRWHVVSKTAAMDIYQTPSNAVKATATTLYLTSNAAGTARLLLFLEA